MTFELGRVSKTIPHLLADTFELVCATENTPFSSTDGYSLIQTAVKTGEESVDPDVEDLDDDGEPDGESSAEVSSRDQGYVDEAFRVLEYRVRAFGSKYPFRIEEGRLSLKKKIGKIQKVYLFLLACSRLRSFRSSHLYQSLPDQFELLCKDVMTQMLPKGAKVTCFGPKSIDRKKNFHTDLRKAIPLLAKYMGMKLSPDWDPQQYAAQGDAKLDIIGVQQLDRTESGWNVFLGQCAAQEVDRSWEKKRQEALFEAHVAKFHSPVRSQGVLFVPVSYRQANGTFFKTEYVTMVLFMDRDRIMALCEPSFPSLDCLASFAELR
jgi:hypothetical protein